MDFTTVTSKENSLIKLASKLQSSAKARRENNKFILEGLRICQDALENGIRFDKLIVTENAVLKHPNIIEDFYKNSNEAIKIPENLFAKISDTDSPQGILILCDIPQNNIEIDIFGKYIALENIADPSNLGAIARTAEALGISGIILSHNGCDPYSPKSLRASMGTILRIPIIIFNDFCGEIKKSELKAYACVVDNNAAPVNRESFVSGTVLMIGNEANGLSENAKSIASRLITIPMRGKAESLNAAAAAAIAMWELIRG